MEMTFADMLRSAIRMQDDFAMLPIDEQQRLTALRKEAYESERCDACGCHSAEHGG